MHSYVWTIGGQAFPNAAPVDVTLGQSVRFLTRNYTMHAHPMHIHGRFFKVVGSGGGTTAPLLKDTVLVPRDHIEPCKMSMDEAMRFAQTAGITGKESDVTRQRMKKA